MSTLALYEYDEIPEPSYDGKYRSIDVPLIKYITARVRKTIEYHNLIDYMKKTMNINTCSFYKDYSMDKGFTIELHHAPLTLFDIVNTVATKHYRLNEEERKEAYVRTWKIEEEVNILHYQFMVGLIPLNPTAHKLVHSGELKPHPRMIIGNWKRFSQEYDEYLDDEVKGKLEEFIVIGKTNPDEMPDVIKYKPVMISNLKFLSLGSVNLQELIVEKLKINFLENKKNE